MDALVVVIEGEGPRRVDDTYRAEYVVNDAGQCRSRVVHVDGQRCEHVADTADGRWVYRRS
jgi:hypothetical protein